MKQGFAANVAATAPSIPSGWDDGYPSDGNPLTPIPPTQPGAYWFHMIGTSIERVITAAGLTPDASNLDLLKNAISATVPSGTVIAFAKNTAPAGYLKCDGMAISRSIYSALFSVIGTTFGVGDGSTTFNLPDMRGQFVRGWADAGVIDAGRVFGSTQLDELKSHSHNSWALAAGSSVVAGGSTHVVSTAATSLTGGSETRPRNVAHLYCIKI